MTLAFSILDEAVDDVSPTKVIETIYSCGQGDYLISFNYALPATALVLTKTQMQHDVMKVVKLNAVQIVRFVIEFSPDISRNLVSSFLFLLHNGHL